MLRDLEVAGINKNMFDNYVSGEFNSLGDEASEYDSNTIKGQIL